MDIPKFNLGDEIYYVGEVISSESKDCYFCRGKQVFVGPALCHCPICDGLGIKTTYTTKKSVLQGRIIGVFYNDEINFEQVRYTVNDTAFNDYSELTVFKTEEEARALLRQ